MHLYLYYLVVRRSCVLFLICCAVNMQRHADIRRYAANLVLTCICMHFQYVLCLYTLIKSYAVQLKVLRMIYQLMHLCLTRSYAIRVLSYAESYAGFF